MASIRQKILTLLFISLIASSSILSLLITNTAYQVQEKDIKEKLTLTTDNTQKDVQIYNRTIEKSVENITNLVTSTLDLPKSQTNPSGYLPSYLTSIGPQVLEITKNTTGAVGGYVYFNKDIYQGIYDVWYLIEDGKFIKTPKQESPDMFYPENEAMVWYYAPIIQKKPLWTEVYFDEILKENCISYVQPIIINNQVVGMVGMDTSFADRQNYIASQKIFTDGFAFLIDKNQKYIVKPKIDIVTPEILKRITALSTKENTGVIDSTNNYFSFTNTNFDQILITTVPKKEILDPIRSMVLGLAAIGAIITIIVMIIGYFVANTITTPIKKLKDFVNGIGQGHYDHPIDIHSQDEVGILAKSFEDMRASIQDKNRELKEYSQNLEKTVNKRTQELEEKIKDLESFQKLTVDREIKMVELKEEINKLKNKI